MVMTEGNAVDNAAPAPQVVHVGPSAAELGAAIANGLKHAGFAAPQAAQPARKSRVEERLQKFKDNPESDPSVVSSWEDLAKDLRADILDEVKEAGGNQTAQELIAERGNNAMEYVTEQLETIFEDEENADELVDLARARLTQMVDDAKYTDLKSKIAGGSKERKALRDLAKESATAIQKLLKRDTGSKEGKGVTGIADGASTANAKTVAKPDAGETSLESLSDAQLEWFNQRVRNMVSVGISEQDAAKEALKRAKNLKV